MMLKLSLDRQYNAAIYLRLSKEDGDFSFSAQRHESNSISNQRLLILDYLKKHPEITVVREYCDDGFTGANFERPQFQAMIAAVKRGEIDCIVVKDLSRFGREYIDSGNYLQKVFPLLGVRFIAINDGYDNAQPGAAESDLILPFKNLMNDSYCRDISIKVRTNLEVKRRNGQFVGSKVIYGYMRDPNNKNKLIIDPDAAQVVQDIFKWKLDGLSPAQIADRLNEDGILSPMEYKKSKGCKQRTAFQTKSQALWSAVAIYRILGNEMYTGTLVQGKTTTPNHKVKKTVVKDKSEWARTEHAHEAIITAAQFDIVRGLMQEDTRSPVGTIGVHPFSGKIFCADCGSPMVRKVSQCGNREYVYYVCGGNKADRRTCSSHSIKESLVYETVLAVIQAQISVALDVSEALNDIDHLAWENRELQKIENRIESLKELINKNQRLKTDAYEDLSTQLIDREEYEAYKAQFDKKIYEAQEMIAKLVCGRNSLRNGLSEQQGWLAQFKQYENIHEITRGVVVHLIERITIRSSKDIDVTLKHRDQFAAIVEFLNEKKARAGTVRLIHPTKEAM